MSKISHLPRCGDAPAGQTPARQTAGKTLHSLLDALCGGLAAHREYERLMSMGMRHDPALRAALSQASHCREASARGPSFQSAFLSLVAAENRPSISEGAPTKVNCKPTGESYA
jgi:hypothetical protein